MILGTRCNTCAAPLDHDCPLCVGCCAREPGACCPLADEPCGVEAYDIHGNTVCDREYGHEGAHGGPTVAGLRLRWSGHPPAPPLSPEEREVVDRLEAAGDPFACNCGHPRQTHGLPIVLPHESWCESCDCLRFAEDAP